MIETISFLLGIGFSWLVYERTIRSGPFSTGRKVLYAVISTIGITGTIWLSGVLIAHFLRKLQVLGCMMLREYSLDRIFIIPV
ncbi:MAG: hypothetical protein OEW15_08550 [Nitrospirota bacterium]|nr:hypothetical protein [Nitrospirota bacterium]